MNNDYEFSVWPAGFLLILGLAVVYFYGWVENIILLIHSTHSIFTPENVIRIIGIPVGILGAVMGFIH